LFKELGGLSMYGVQLQVGQQLMTARQFEKTGSVINLQARKRNTSPKRKSAKISS